MSEATPRITAAYLETFQGQTIRLVGKVVALRGEVATVDAGGQVTVVLNRDSRLQIGHAFEIVGKVNPELKVRMLNGTDFGTNIDFNAVNAVVDATHRHKEIFYGDDS